MNDKIINLKGVPYNRLPDGTPREIWLTEGISTITKKKEVHPYDFEIYSAVQRAIEEGIINLDFLIAPVPTVLHFPRSSAEHIQILGLRADARYVAVYIERDRVPPYFYSISDDTITFTPPLSNEEVTIEYIN